MNELYDLESDPFELSNLIDSPSAAAVRRRLEAELEGILASGPAPRP
jgi:hypothetical protein